MFVAELDHWHRGVEGRELGNCMFLTDSIQVHISSILSLKSSIIEDF